MRFHQLKICGYCSFSHRYHATMSRRYPAISSIKVVGAQSFRENQRKRMRSRADWRGAPFSSGHGTNVNDYENITQAGFILTAKERCIRDSMNSEMPA